MFYISAVSKASVWDKKYNNTYVCTYNWYACFTRKEFNNNSVSAIFLVFITNKTM